MSQANGTPTTDLMWQINVLHDVQKTSTIILTVTKDCYTAELFEKLRQHPKAPKIENFDLFSISGTTRSALIESQEERLSAYGITDRSTLVLVARLEGGVWPTLEEVEAEPRHLKPADGITLTTISAEHPDVMDIEVDGPGVIMRCGHATAPMPLARYCLSELEKGKDEIRCPKCDAKWKFALLKPAACLTPNEITEFERRAHINYFRQNQSDMNPCPKCGTFSRPKCSGDKRVICLNCASQSGEQYEFCWTCLGEWKTLGNETCGNPDCGSNKALYEILANCEKKELNGVEIPSKRACPNCSFIIHHDEGCKHMTCTHCKYEFCFICLKKFPCLTDVYEPCDVATIQTCKTKFISSSFDPEENIDRITVTDHNEVFAGLLDDDDDYDDDDDEYDEEIEELEEIYDDAELLKDLYIAQPSRTEIEEIEEIYDDAELLKDLYIAQPSRTLETREDPLSLSTDIAQPSRTLETTEVPHSSSTDTSSPDNQTRRPFCIIQ